MSFNYPDDLTQASFDEAQDQEERMIVIGEPEPLGVTMENVYAEVRRAQELFPPLHSAHEGYATLLEEVDELWDEVKGNHPDRESRMKSEAIQVAAMALRFVDESCSPRKEPTE